ncbi:MAG: glycosyltransferase family 39 protein [Chloroflexota bacterium]
MVKTESGASTGDGALVRYYDKFEFALAFVAVVLFGALLRIARLHSIPPGLFFDEAADLFDIVDVLHGARPIYFPRNNGREPLFFYWASLFASLWGTNAYAIRLSSAVAGTFTVVAVFLCAREFLRLWTADRRWSDWVALASSFVFSILYLHLHFSRIGLRPVTLPLCLALGYGMLFRGIRRNSWLALAGAGFFGGLSLYTYIPGRLAPVPLLFLPFALGFPRRSWRPFWQMMLVGIIWLAVWVPLGVYAVHHPSDVLGHTDDVSILNPVNDHGDPTGAVIHGVVATLGGFSFAGTENADQNLPGRPILDPLLSFFFFVGLIGLALGARRLKTSDGPDRAGSSRPAVIVFLVVWILTQSVPSALAVDPPGFPRMFGTLPAVAILAGTGVGFAWRWLAAHRVTAVRTSAIVAVALAISAAWTIHDYFWVWGPSADAYHWMMGDKVDSATYLNRWAARERVFLAPLYAQDNTIKFLTRSSSIQSFDLADLVIPTDRSRGVRYVFPISEAPDAVKLARELPAPATTGEVKDPTGRYTLLATVELPATELPAPPARRLATFDGGIDLAGATVEPASIAPGQSLLLSLEWLDARPQPYDYTVFVHLRDASNRTVAQVDQQPTKGSFPTTAWRPGDLIWDRYTLVLPADLPPGDYHLVAGLYRLATLQRLMANVGDGQPPTNEVTIGRITVHPR